jgi:hypothetical protein
MTADQILAALKTFLEDKMAYNRTKGGKFDVKNHALWEVKKKLQELDPTVTNVGATYDEHENANYDNR